MMCIITAGCLSVLTACSSDKTLGTAETSATAATIEVSETAEAVETSDAAVTTAASETAETTETSATAVSKTADAAAETAAGVVCSAVEDKEFGGIFTSAKIDAFTEAGIEYGDSCTITFDSGEIYEDVPFYTGYYGYVGQLIIVDYPAYDSVKLTICDGGSIWKESGCKDGDRFVISLEEKGRYLRTQEVMNMTFSNNMDDYESEESFANFRAIEGGNMKPGILYRGASPVDDVYGRAHCVDSLIEKHGIGFVLDLADNEEKLDKYRSTEKFDSPYYMSLYDDGRVNLTGLTINYRSQEYKTALARGLNNMASVEGPYYVHCTMGVDRTGFVCVLLECMAGFSYEEMEKDYMQSYAAYYNITAESDPDKYDTLKNSKFDDFIYMLANQDGSGSDGKPGQPDISAVKDTDFERCAFEYLTSAGMTEEEYMTLKERLCGTGAAA